MSRIEGLELPIYQTGRTSAECFVERFAERHLQAPCMNLDCGDGTPPQFARLPGDAILSAKNTLVGKEYPPEVR